MAISPSRDTLHCNATPASVREVLVPSTRFLQLLTTNDFRHLRARRGADCCPRAFLSRCYSCQHRLAKRLIRFDGFRARLHRGDGRVVVGVFVAWTEVAVSCGHGYTLGIGVSRRQRRLSQLCATTRQLRYIHPEGCGSSATFASVPSTRRPIQNWSRKAGQIRPSRVRRAMLSSSAPRLVFGRKGLNEPLSTATVPSPRPCAILRISQRSRRPTRLLRSMTSSP